MTKKTKELDDVIERAQDFEEFKALLGKLRVHPHIREAQLYAFVRMHDKPNFSFGATANGDVYMSCTNETGMLKHTVEISPYSVRRSTQGISLIRDIEVEVYDFSIMTWPWPEEKAKAQKEPELGG